MFGDEPGVIQAITPLEVHGLRFWDVSLRFDDGRVEEARLGDEAVPGGSHAGERVWVMRAGPVVIGLGRAID